MTKESPPYNLRNCAYLEEFEKEKIVYSEIVRDSQFFLDSAKFYAEATTFVLTGKDLKFLLGCLNSKFITFAFKEFYAGGNLGSQGFRYKKQFLELLPIPKIDSSNQKEANKIINLVEQILESKSQKSNNIKSKNIESNNKDKAKDTKKLEEEIDFLVYKLYNLDELEIKIIEGE